MKLISLLQLHQQRYLDYLLDIPLNPILSTNSPLANIPVTQIPPRQLKANCLHLATLKKTLSSPRSWSAFRRTGRIGHI